MRLLGAVIVVIIGIPAFLAGMLYASLRTGFVSGVKAIDDFGDRLVAEHRKKKEAAKCGS